jgi:hypothetical protein
VVAIIRHRGEIPGGLSALLVRAMSILSYIQGMSTIVEVKGDAPEMTTHHGASESVLYARRLALDRDGYVDGMSI